MIPILDDIISFLNNIYNMAYDNGWLMYIAGGIILLTLYIIIF